MLNSQVPFTTDTLKKREENGQLVRTVIWRVCCLIGFANEVDSILLVTEMK